MKTFLTFLLSLLVLGSSYAADSSKTAILSDALDATLAAFTNSLTVLTVGTINATAFNAGEVNTPLLNATNLSTPLITNVAGILLAICRPSITQSNFLITGLTNHYKIRGATNVIATNIVELAEGVASGVIVFEICNTLAVSVPLLLPVFGAHDGYFFHTNDLPAAWYSGVAPPGTNTVIGWRISETNVYASFYQARAIP